MSSNISPSYNLDINTRSTYDVVEAICDKLTKAGLTIIERDDFSFLDRMVVTLESIYGDNDAGIFIDIHCTAEHGAIDGTCAIYGGDEVDMHDLKELFNKYSAVSQSCEPSNAVKEIIDLLKNNL